MHSLKGKAVNIKSHIIGRFSKKKFSMKELFHRPKIRYVENNNFPLKTLAGISEKDLDVIKKPAIINIKDDIGFNEGDIIKLSSSGHIQCLWNVESKQNVLFLTDQCNSRCIMCPQPLTSDGNYVEDVKTVLAMLENKDVTAFCISGGEPTIIKENFIEVLSMCKKKFSEIPLLVLTNGRNFKNFDFCKDVVKSMPKYTTFAIPIYSSVPSKHDEIVNVHGAFKESILGIQNLTRFRAVVEIRTVILKKNYRMLPLLADYIGWNLPMVSHVAFMGMEVHNMAIENFEDVWIEPIEYQDELKIAVKKLDYRNINVSVYNLPHCLLPKDLWKYSCKSISDWKEYYLPVCQSCSQKDVCAGLFATSSQIPKGIKTIE